MRYTTAAAFRRALEDRLAAITVETGQPVIRLRKLVAFDRLLARLVAAAPGAWRLKGAVALEYRFDVEVLSGPDLLGFAGIAPIRVPVVPLEQHLAEKVHAYTRIYAGGQRSSRSKDLIDVLLIRDRAEIWGDMLRLALTSIFDERGTHRLPDRFPEPPEDWKPAFERLAEEVGREADLTMGYLQAAAFVNPVLEGSNPGCWSPLDGAWVPDEEAR